MNPKIEKLKEERQKNDTKIAELQERNKVIDRKIREYENTEIVGMFRSSDFTIEEIRDIIASAKATKGGN